MSGSRCETHRYRDVELDVGYGNHGINKDKLGNYDI